MENVQRAVMLLKPDAHVMGQWDSGATLKLMAVPGGIALALRIDGHFGEGGILTLFMRDGSAHAAGAVTSVLLEVKLGGVHVNEVAGAAVIQDNRFVLKSPMPDWPAVIARYRFAQKQAEPHEEAVEALEQAEPENNIQVEMELTQQEEDQAPVQQTQQDNMPLQNDAPMPWATELNTDYDEDMDEYAPQRVPYREPEDECPGGIRQNHIEPFPGEFPGSEWVKISYPGPAGWWHYIFGHMRMSGDEVDIIGVPGEYSMAPPVWLDGFSTWVRCTSGDARGYWLMFQNAQTGQVLDIGRSRRGG